MSKKTKYDLIQERIERILPEVEIWYGVPYNESDTIYIDKKMDIKGFLTILEENGMTIANIKDVKK